MYKIPKTIFARNSFMHFSIFIAAIITLLKKSLPAVLICSVTPWLTAQTTFHQNLPKVYHIHKTNTRPIIDGKIDQVWQIAGFTDKFVDIQGDKMPLPAFDTRVKMLWDDSTIYFLAVLDEHHICAFLTNHDDIIFYDNDFEIFIDPDDDTFDYFEIEINAFATVWDLFLSRPYKLGGRAIFNWDMKGAEWAVHVLGTLNNPNDTDTAWVIEMAIPFSNFAEGIQHRKLPKAGDYWRTNFSRVQWQYDRIDGKYVKKTDPATGKNLPEDNWVWSPMGKIQMHCPEKWGYIWFVDEKINNNSLPQYPKSAIPKKILYTLFEAQNSFFVKNNHYSKNLKHLITDDLQIAGSHYTVEFEISKSYFVIHLIDKNEKLKYSIDKKGHFSQNQF
jgi:hypothetical protein